MRTVEKLNIANLEPGRAHHLQVELVQNGAGNQIAVPMIVLRGRTAGPVLGVTAVIHGNELNGLPVIHRLVASMDIAQLSGTLVAVPVVNVPGYLENVRAYRDGQDLNRLMPGREPGSEAEVYAHRFVERVLRQVEYLIDLHTASFGRANALYVRANLSDTTTETLAHLIGAQVIVHNEGADGTLRAAAADLGIHAIAVEVGDPNRFQKGLIKSSRLGVQAVLEHLGMMPTTDTGPDEDDAIVCGRSFWMYTDVGGVLEVFPAVADMVKKGDRVAHVSDLFGTVVRTYESPEDGVVVGKSVNPVAHTGSRVLHLGVLL